MSLLTVKSLSWHKSEPIIFVSVQIVLNTVLFESMDEDSGNVFLGHKYAVE